MDNFLESVASYKAPDDFTFEEGTRWWMEIAQYKHLLEKHKNFCFMRIRFNINPLKFDMSTGFVHTSPQFKKDINDCFIKLKRFIVIPVIILYKNNITHINVVIVDKQKKTIERFDPQGTAKKYYLTDEIYFNYNIINSIEFDKQLYHIFKKFLPNYNYIDTDFIGLGPQHREKLIGYKWKKKNNKWHRSLGYCGTWTLWYVDLRLSFPDYSIKVLLAEAYDSLDRIGYNDFIENLAYTIQLRGQKLYSNLPESQSDWSDYLEYLTMS